MSTALNLGFTLAFDPFGKLVVTLADGTQHVGAVVARAFPIATPDQCISILSAEGKELVWVENLNDLPVNERDIVFFPPEFLMQAPESFHADVRTETGRAATRDARVRARS